MTEVIDNAGWRLDGDAQDAPPQSMRRVVECRFRALLRLGDVARLSSNSRNFFRDLE